MKYVLTILSLSVIGMGCDKAAFDRMDAKVDANTQVINGMTLYFSKLQDKGLLPKPETVAKEDLK